MTSWLSSIKHFFGGHEKKSDTIRGKALPPVYNLVDFPEEILLDCLKYLSPENLARCQMTCRKLKNVAADDILWRPLLFQRALQLPTAEVQNGYFYKFESFYRNCKLLKLREKDTEERATKRQKFDDSKLFIDFLTHHKDFLQSLHFLTFSAFSEFSDLAMLDSVEYLTKNCKSVESINFVHLKYNSNDQRVLILALTAFALHCPNLKKITLRQYPFNDSIKNITDKYYKDKKVELAPL